MFLNFTVPYDIAWELMRTRNLYSKRQRKYVQTYSRWYSAPVNQKKYIEPYLDDAYRLLEQTWNELCGYDAQLHACAEMLSVNRFSFFQAIRIFNRIGKMNPESHQIGHIIHALNNDGTYYMYNGNCFSPEEIVSLLWRGKWSKVR